MWESCRRTVLIQHVGALTFARLTLSFFSLQPLQARSVRGATRTRRLCFNGVVDISHTVHGKRNTPVATGEQETIGSWKWR